MTEIELLRSAAREYRGLLASSEVEGTEKVDMNRLVQHLSRAHDWTEQGARVIVTLANEYGAIMLRNALALALALGKEDGDLGF
jgi:predicted transcriptional regulator of viral defense system